jgi:hypothetical protein
MTNSYPWQLEVDGRWYVTDGQRSPVGTNGGYVEVGGVLLDFESGHPWTNLPLLLNADWRTAHSNEVGTAKFGGGGFFVPDDFHPEPLKLPPGKHTIRLAVIAMAMFAPGGPVRAVSNPVQIDVAPGAGWRAALAGKYMPGYTLRPVRRQTGNQESAVEILAAPSGEETDLASAIAAWRGVPRTLPPAALAASVSSQPGYCWRNPKLTTLLTALKLKIATASEAEDFTRLILGLFKGWTSFDGWTLKAERCEYGWVVTPSYVGPPAQVFFQGPVELVVEDGVLVDARQGGEMLPHPAGVSDRMADAAEPGWGEPVEGFSMRLQSDKPVWYLASDSPGFRFSVRNLGGEVLSVPESEELGELEMDGVWYAWSDKYYGPFQPLAPGRQVDNLAVFPISSWGKVPSQFPTAAGTHKIRFALVARREQPHHGQTIRAVSNPIQVEFRFGLAPKQAVQPVSLRGDDPSANPQSDASPARSPKTPETILAEIRNILPDDWTCELTLKPGAMKGSDVESQDLVIDPLFRLDFTNLNIWLAKYQLPDGPMLPTHPSLRLFFLPAADKARYQQGKLNVYHRPVTAVAQTPGYFVVTTVMDINNGFGGGLILSRCLAPLGRALEKYFGKFADVTTGRVLGLPEDTDGLAARVGVAGQVVDDQTGKPIPEFALEWSVADAHQPGDYGAFQSNKYYYSYFGGRFGENREFQDKTPWTTGQKVWLRIRADDYLPAPLTPEPVVWPVKLTNLIIRLKRAGAPAPPAVRPASQRVDGASANPQSAIRNPIPPPPYAPQF